MLWIQEEKFSWKVCGNVNCELNLYSRVLYQPSILNTITGSKADPMVAYFVDYGAIVKIEDNTNGDGRNIFQKKKE